MHIEPGVVDGAKIVLSYATALAAFGFSAKASIDMIKKDGFMSLIGRSTLTTLFVFAFFELLPHHAVGVSEVHLILGSTLFLIFGPAAASVGLILGLLTQGVFFAQFDLPQYGMNVTTLLLPLFAMSAVARRTIAENTAYVDISYKQALKLSLTYQGGIVAWVAFWAFYGQGFGAENVAAVATFGMAYLSVVLIEPILDLAVLAGAKSLHRFKNSSLFEARLFN
ncbi:MAG: energy-coupling factor ABC transporter permease [Gammaproteobacteria bacterium]|nr:energy-coupling factor ABC transporter permease [Gammaproteobacteria bacterium]MBU1466776.1 energy-coupling factor ABC transporter permease [Gammaproteobacteria bacterium]MBU2022920.1 energy-coupling factor ABC transporter permease [Gammaproteobacteria bacterium]MBU2238346.1 energy-coupling factor ABC transporter permease [Gammaproteobacteria bacterium]MBU2412814.1 energy-coupling factor ABC transporter permease [Gammaproteobacteria bacterium]